MIVTIQVGLGFWSLGCQKLEIITNDCPDWQLVNSVNLGFSIPRSTLDKVSLPKHSRNIRKLKVDGEGKGKKDVRVEIKKSIKIINVKNKGCEAQNIK